MECDVYNIHIYIYMHITLYYILYNIILFYIKLYYIILYYIVLYHIYIYIVYAHTMDGELFWDFFLRFGIFFGFCLAGRVVCLFHGANRCIPWLPFIFQGFKRFLGV